MAASNLDVIKGLNGKKQVLVRETYFEALRMYVASAGLALIPNLFVWAHKLSSENEDAVLAADRVRQPDPPVCDVVGEQRLRTIKMGSIRPRRLAQNQVTGYLVGPQFSKSSYLLATANRVNLERIIRS
ncbi:hypothetical protein AARAC_007533, partial [Aspergillus arachidicola]